MAHSPVCWRVSSQQGTHLWVTGVDFMLLMCCVPGYQGWVSCSSPVRTSSGRAAWASQSRRDKSPFGCTAMCLWAARSPQTCRAFLYTTSDNKDALSTLFLERCLTCFHSGWLVCLVLQDTVALFYPSCPGTWGKPCGTVKCLGEMLSISASMHSCWS